MSDLPPETIADIIAKNGRGTHSNEARDLALEVKRRRSGAPETKEAAAWICGDLRNKGFWALANEVAVRYGLPVTEEPHFWIP